ncbi:hypothetical protein [Pontibacter mangrovi]|uniref:Uncharacterized protein n=1 Tax=Pontibacter mangrovi TaxID=2589816 RepID=A0A501WJ11_9BACT|nr:hypothetical protein [Pontibacter mangrovi]TPE45586.1 hypothetical protein FJM65_06060 [Pontibacter mangrovi]
MENLLHKVLLNLKQTKKEDFVTLETSLSDLIDSFSPRNSVKLGTNFIQKVITSTDNITFVLLGHLYIERLLNEILLKEFDIQDIKKANKSLNTFYKKVVFLKKAKTIDEELINDILLINSLRNAFAHELNYKLSNFNIWKLSALQNVERNDFEPNSKAAKDIFTRLIIKVYFFKILRDLTEKFRFLSLLNEG